MSNEIKLNDIKINNEYYGTTDSAHINFKDTTVYQELTDINTLLASIPNAQIVTQAEYDALGDKVNSDDVVYYIIDAGLDGTAKNLAYDNTVSKMSATNVQDAIDTCFQSVNDGKSVLAATLTNLGIPTASTDSFKKIGENIRKVLAYQEELARKKGKEDAVAATKVGTAVAADVLAGKTFTNSSSIGVTGTMPNKGAVSATLKPGPSASSYTIPAGYHNGSGVVSIGTQQAKASSMSLTINQACYYDGDSSSYAAINVQGYNKLSRKRTGSNNVSYVYLLAYDKNGTETQIHSSTADITNLDVSKYVYLQQKFRAKEPSSKPYFSSTITLSV
jgi:hypothetical protein